MDNWYPETTKEPAQKRTELAPEIHASGARQVSAGKISPPFDAAGAHPVW